MRRTDPARRRTKLARRSAHIRTTSALGFGIVALLTSLLAATAAGAQTYTQLADSTALRLCGALAAPDVQRDTVHVILPTTVTLAATQQATALYCTARIGRDVTRRWNTRYSVSDTTIATVTKTTGIVTFKRAGRVIVKACWPAPKDTRGYYYCPPASPLQPQPLDLRGAS